MLHPHRRLCSGFDSSRRTGRRHRVARTTRTGREAIVPVEPSAVVNPAAVAGTPRDFQAYVQASRGEFGCAKPSYVRTRPGWVSDRTVCYLASGRPCVVEATGAEEHLPASGGLRFFTTTDEAAAAIAAIESDYAVASRAARALAEEVFSTSAVLPRLLQVSGAA